MAPSDGRSVQSPLPTPESSLRERVVHKLVGWAFSLYGLFYFAILLFMPKGAKNCINEVAQQSLLIENAIVSRTMWTRSMDGHWIAAVVYESKALGDTARTTVICHYETNNFKFANFEVERGDVVDKIKRLSKSHVDPLMVFEQWGYNGPLRK